MSSQLDFAALEDCLKTLNHLYIDINRLKAEAGYETKRGGYGEVQVSRLDSGTAGSKLVAAKRIYLKARHKEHERLAFRLARELKVWASLHHPHVLPVVGYYLDKDCRIAVLMSEYMAHGDLKDYIEQEKPSWDARLYLIRDTTAGLAYLHGQDPPIRHGDLKTGNVLINAERRAVLADFGLSRTLEEGPTGLTTSDGLKGTLRYYSPEIVAETADCHSLPSDIWAWACLALEVLADIIPYAGKKSEHSIIKALMNNEPPSDTTSLPIPVPAVKHLLARCWTIQPNGRPSVDHCLAIIDTELSALQMTPGVGRDSDQGSYLQSSNFDENYSFNRPHEDGGWPPAMGSQPGPNPTAIQNRLGMTQGPQESLAAQDGLSWAPANFTPPMTQQIGRERLQTMVNARAFQQQQQASAPPRVPSNQPLQTSPQQQSQPGPSNRQMQFHEFFTIAFNQWLSQRQLTLDPLLVDGKEVALHELFLVVGALGGCRAVFEKKLWPVVGGKIGFPYFNGAIPYSKPEVAEQLSKIYQKILADFEVHWHNSLRPLDPNSIFPLPAQLQYLHPEIGRLTTIQFLLPQPQQPRRPLGAGPQQPPDGGPTAQLSATIASLNVSPEQLSEAREKVRAALNLLANKRDYSSINLSHEQRILLPHSIQQTQSLLKQVAQNLVAFVVLAPNDERELNLVVQTVVTLSDQAQILLRQPPENRFIFGLDDLNQYRNHLTRFLMRVKGLQSQAMGLQSQQASDALPPGPPPPKPPTINSQFTLGKKPVPKRKLPPKRGATKPTSKIPPAEVRGISRPEPERPQSSKREREDNVTGLGGSAGPYGPPKRVRTDRQEDLDAKRAADLAAAKQLTIEGSLHFLPKMAKEDEKVATGVQPEEEEDWSWAIDSTQWATEEEAAPVPSQNAPAPGVNPEEGDDWLWAIDSSQWATEDPAVGETQG